MTNELKQPFHKTGQFRQVCKNLSGKVSFTGTVKLHGTNASIVKHEDGEISFHSKSNCLATYKDGDFTLKNDNYGFAQAMHQRIEEVLCVLRRAEKVLKESYGVVAYPLKLSGEWCGQGIQKGVGISYLNKRSLFLFGLHSNATGWVTNQMLYDLTTPDSHEEGLYSITDFGVFSIDIDFNLPELSQAELEQLTLGVEERCPVSNQLGLVDSQGAKQRLGEGIVWAPSEHPLCEDSDNFFKVKGSKHAVNTPKSIVTVSPEKLRSVQAFVDYAVTENRLVQGLGEVGLDKSTIGTFIGWVNRDIYEEESDTLKESGLTMKDVGKHLTNKSREFYMEKLNNA
tara:strand:- start:3217 stop:4239 length:1023 start_codon:yes stop_codon:yes gene_type:complete